MHKRMCRAQNQGDDMYSDLNLKKWIAAACLFFVLPACQTPARFVDENKEDLSLEMATGEGPRLQRLAAMHDCRSPEAQAAFMRMTQQSYGQIYAGSESTGREILDNLKQELMHWNDVQDLCSPTASLDTNEEE